MAVAFTTTYLGDLRTAITHEPSGTVIETDAPIDNHGRGERFSPTDLVAASLGSCMLTIMGIVAKREGLDLSGTKVQVESGANVEIKGGAAVKISGGAKVDIAGPMINIG